MFKAIFVSIICKSRSFKRNPRDILSLSFWSTVAHSKKKLVWSLMSIFWCIVSYDIDFLESSAQSESFREQPFLLALYALFFTAG